MKYKHACHHIYNLTFEIALFSNFQRALFYTTFLNLGRTEGWLAWWLKLILMRFHSRIMKSGKISFHSNILSFLSKLNKTLHIPSSKGNIIAKLKPPKRNANSFSIFPFPIQLRTTQHQGYSMDHFEYSDQKLHLKSRIILFGHFQKAYLAIFYTILEASE